VKSPSVILFSHYSRASKTFHWSQVVS